MPREPTTAREVVIAEVLGEAATLLSRLEALAPLLCEGCQAFQQADNQLEKTLSSLETRLKAITENAQRQTVRYMATHVEAATQGAAQEQRKAMADAARTAFGHEFGATLQRLNAALQRLEARMPSRWVALLIYLATAFAASTAGCLLTLHLVLR